MTKPDSSAKTARIFYARTDEFWRKGEKYAFLEEREHVGGVEWQELRPDAKGNWLTEGMKEEFESFVPIVTREGRRARELKTETIFKDFGFGLKTARDAIVYDFDRNQLLRKAEQFCDGYNADLHRYIQKGRPVNIDDFLEHSQIKLSRNLKRHISNGVVVKFDESKIRWGMYRAFTKSFLYYDRVLIDELGGTGNFFPTPATEKENLMLCLPHAGGRTNYWCYCVGQIPASTLTSVDMNQCFPFYTYDEDGTNRRENITDWALEKFRAQYGDASITKWDIFHYVYALLHHHAYRERYAANLKRELPRVPFAPDFRAFAEAGARLADLHVNYERQPEYPLERVENPRAPLDWRVERMKLSKDKTQIVYNDFLTLAGVPPEAFEYRLGNRSALEWVIDQYQVSTDKRSGITNDPNRADDPQYVVRLVGQVIGVSLETVAVVRALPDLEAAGA